MRIKLLSLVATTYITVCSMAQGLKVNPGATFKTNSGVNVVLHNLNLINNGNGDFSNSNLYVNGNSSSYVGGTSAITVSNLYINENTSNASLQSDLNVTNNVVFQNGLLDLNGHNLLLSPAGLLVNENEFNHVTGSAGGYVSITVNLDAPAGANPGNLGAVITSTKNLGSVLIQRGHTSQTKNGNGKSILRYYNIVPTNNAGLKATFRFYYLDAELNGLTESGLDMWRSANGGSTWAMIAASGQNIALNYIEASNVNAFYEYTLSSSTFSFDKTFAGLNSENMQQDNKISSVVLSPNPVPFQGKVTIMSTGKYSSGLNIFSADGKKVMQQPVYLQEGINEVPVDMNTLQTGTYFLVVQMYDGTKKTISFTKQ